MKKFAIGGVNEHFNFPWRKSIEEGIFLRENIDLHWQDVAGGTGIMTKMLASGELDFSVMLTEGLLLHAMQENDIALLQFHVKSPLRWGIHVREENKNLLSQDLSQFRFAISRFNSGSHLMVLVMAHQFGWNISKEQFIVVNSLEGGLESLKNKNADVFLWEKYTTHPFLRDFSLAKIGEVPTPWPPFSLAVNKRVHEKYPETAATICKLICETNRQLKNDTGQTAKTISERYKINISDAQSWLYETEWNTIPGIRKSELQEVLHALSEENLCTAAQAASYESLLIMKS